MALLIAAGLAGAAPARADSVMTAIALEHALKMAPTDPGRGISPIKTDPGASGSAPASRPAEAPSALLVVQFANGSAALTQQAVRQLTELGKALTSADLSGARFRIEGHTDTVGGADYNATLSRERATAVVDYLVGAFGIDGQRLDAVGLGKDQLLVATPDQTPEPLNRRVKVVNLGP
jgi:outer membrane protein OmpA-like peptidoglycan-associated protein